MSVPIGVQVHESLSKAGGEGGTCKEKFHNNMEAIN